ncbi:MAG: DUF6789 family protein [Chloroflexota bacterium]
MHLSSVIRGALAGLIATGPMTISMIIMHRYLGATERYPLPPREITARIVAGREARTGKEMSESAWTTLTLASHLSYGVATGAIFGIIEDRTPTPLTVKGIIWGMIVWAGSYLVLLPALRILKPATEHPGSRNILMIVAHLIWGATLGLMVEQLKHGVELSGLGEFEPDREAR